MTTKISAEVVSVNLDNNKASLQVVSPKGIKHRVGVGVRHAGDDASTAYRIPGLVTTNKEPCWEYMTSGITIAQTCRNM